MYQHLQAFNQAESHLNKAKEIIERFDSDPLSLRLGNLYIKYAELMIKFYFHNMAD